MKQSLPGVSPCHKKNGEPYFRSSITFLRKHISLGSYVSERLAYLAYKEAQTLLSDTGITLHTYRPDSVLLFEKWVVLINFRDNHLYFSTPIYIHKKYFDYYLSPGHVLLFDIDDLFYYSSHKIMSRGNHYFVADYGMQINILGRYGIKNYAVIDRDYRFINENRSDFRYENIEIQNRFHGVIMKKTKKGLRYMTRIHINGNYTVGTYPNEYTAAIAYNKAIDLLHKNGVKKHFTPNYLEEISPSQYADIYRNVKVSAKVAAYLPE